MSAIDLITSGTDGAAFDEWNEKDYTFDTSLVLPPYHKDPKTVEQEVKTKAIADRIIFVETRGKKEHVLVDGAVNVEQNSAADRQQHINFWSGKRVWMIVGTVVAAAAFVGTAAAGYPHSDQLWPGLGYLMAMVVEGGFFMTVWNRWGQANDQIAKWNVIPANVVAAQRQEAFGVGFFSAMRFNMKGQYYQTYHGHGLLHPQELDYLYRESFKIMKKDIDKAHDLPDTAKGQCVLRFVNNNPLSLAAWSYVFDDTPSQVFSAEYERMESKISNIKEWFNDLRAQVRTHYDRLVAENNQRFELAKAPFEAAYRYKVAEAKAEYERKIAQHKAGDPAKTTLETERDKTIAGYKALYEMALTPIKMHYDGYKQQLGHWRDGELQRIDHDQWNYVRPLFDEIEALFHKAYARFIEGKNLSKVVTITPATSLYKFQEPAALPDEDLWQKVYSQKSDSPYQDFINYAKYEALKNPNPSLQRSDRERAG